MNELKRRLDEARMFGHHVMVRVYSRLYEDGYCDDNTWNKIMTHFTKEVKLFYKHYGADNTKKVFGEALAALMGSSE